MSSNSRRRTGAGFTRALMAAALLALASAPSFSQAPAAPAQAKPQDAPAQPPAAPESDPDNPQHYFDTVTVSATLNPTSVKDTPGTVSVIDARPSTPDDPEHAPTW